MKPSAFVTAVSSVWWCATLRAQELPKDFGNPWMSNLVEAQPPPAVSWWPPAPGWYGLAVIAVAVLSRLVWISWRRRRINAYRREGLRRLAAIEELAFAPDSRRTVLGKLPLLLKQVALAAYPRSEVANLSGDEWTRFLDSSMGSEEFSTGPTQLVVELAYAPSAAQRLEDTDIRELFSVVRKWIRRHDRRFHVGETPE